MGLIPFDLETAPLQIKTDSRDDSFEYLLVWFYTADGLQSAGSIHLTFADPPKYKIKSCMKEAQNFPDTLPSDVNKIWTITKLPGPRITIKCNEVTVVDVLISAETCDDPRWNVWSREVEEIEFDYYEEASDEYRPASPGGRPGNPLSIINITFFYTLQSDLNTTSFYSTRTIVVHGFFLKSLYCTNCFAKRLSYSSKH